MNWNELAAGMRDAVKGYVARHNAPLQQRIATLETRVEALTIVLASKGVLPDRVTELETLMVRVKEYGARPELHYVGLWKQGQECREGAFATHGGSLWYCHRTTTDKPGTSSAWQLSVRHGAQLVL